VERRLEAIHTLATTVTSYALDAEKTFPFVTVPHFAMRGSDLRVQADALIVHWMPLVTDETREEWEAYTFENRYHIDNAFEEDAELRQRQDEEFGYIEATSRRLQEAQVPRNVGGSRTLQVPHNESILDDETGFHPRIWSPGSLSPRGDEPEGSGPYLPFWQRR
jgi:hypothetical protein